LFPRSDRSPALTPAAEPVLRMGLLAAIGTQGWSEGRSERVASGFYTSQAWEWER
jgi:magnesium-protoporphyrin O-methyltransferase